eukprot:1138044-Pelagomonas_calceolata.AAC.1
MMSRADRHPCGTPTGAHRHSRRQCVLSVPNLLADPRSNTHADPPLCRARSSSFNHHTMIEHVPCQINFYKVNAHSGVIGNEGAVLGRKLQLLWISQISHCLMPKTLSTTPLAVRQIPPRVLPYSHSSTLLT